MSKIGYTVKEAAEYLGLRPATIDQAKRPGASPEASARFDCPGLKRGKSWWFHRRDLDAWAEALRQKAGAADT